MAEPDIAIYNKLVADSIDSTYSCTLSSYPMREPNSAVNNKSVFIVLTGEDDPIDFMDGSDTSFRFRRCQITVRSEPDEYGAGLTLVEAVRNSLHLATLSGKVACRVFSGPWLLEKDNIDRYIWSMNCEVWEQN